VLLWLHAICQPKVQSWLMQWQGLMVTVAVAIGLCYGVYAIAFSTRGVLKREKERSIEMLTFLFIPNAGYTWCC